jgi:pimeloyl-ACP methyl ester carboxylesterase
LPPSQGFLDANGISLHYALSGNSGRSVVLLHELGGTLNSWDEVAPRLAEHYRVLRYDQRATISAAMAGPRRRPAATPSTRSLTTRWR